jgi:hypothetical protein
VLHWDHRSAPRNVLPVMVGGYTWGLMMEACGGGRGGGGGGWEQQAGRQQEMVSQGNQAGW